MTVVEFSNPHRVAEITGAHPPAITGEGDVTEQLEAWYRWAAQRPHPVILRPALRTYLSAKPLVWDAPNVSVIGNGGVGTKFVTPGITIGGIERANGLEFGHFTVMSPSYHTNGQAGWANFTGTGLSIENHLRVTAHDIHVHGFSDNVVVTRDTAQSNFHRIIANYARNNNFTLRGSNNPNATNGKEWLTDNRFYECRADGNWGAGHIAENGWLFEGYVGDFWGSGCSALSAKIGFKIAPPGTTGGYRHNFHFLGGCYADYCSVATVDFRNATQIRWTGGFWGVRGGVLVGIKDAIIKDAVIGNIEEQAGVRDGVLLADCQHITIAGNSISRFGRGVKVMRGHNVHVEGNSIVQMWNGLDATTVAGHGVLVEQGYAHRIEDNTIDTASVKLIAPILADRATNLTVTANKSVAGVPIQVGSAPPIG